MTATPDVLSQSPRTSTRRSVAGYFLMPAVLLGVLVVLYLSVANQDLDTIEARSLNAARLGTAVWQHVQITAVSTVITLLIAVPLGIILTRPFARREVGS